MQKYKYDFRKTVEVRVKNCNFEALIFSNGTNQILYQT